MTLSLPRFASLRGTKQSRRKSYYYNEDMKKEKNMKRICKRVVLLTAAFMLVFTACHKDAQIEPKMIVIEQYFTDESDDPFFTATTATFYWHVADGKDGVSDFPGKLSSVVKLSRNADMSEAVAYDDDESSLDYYFFVTATGLSPETKYYYCFEVWNPGLDYTSKVNSFTTPALQKPTVTTSSVTQFNYTQATAVGGGEVTDDGEDAVTERGIYYGTNPDPVATGIKLAASSAGTGNFTCTITGLVEETTYYVCAYATNSQGTSYGSEKSFSYNPPPTGAINGIFSVSSNKKLYFSQGNLQYRASDGRWRFAEHQYDCIGESNSNISSSYSNYIDLFGWGTSGWNSGAVCYQPWSTSTTDSDYYPGGSYTNNLTDSYANADWGVYNAIYNGGNQAGQWRTLTKDEWVYVFQDRNNASSKYGHGKVNGVNGVILLPDSWTLPSGLSFTAGDSSWANSYTADQWAQMEANGAVFLPAAGGRFGTLVDYVGSYGLYWSALYDDGSVAYSVNFGSGYLYPSYWGSRSSGHSVRLVAPVE